MDVVPMSPLSVVDSSPSHHHLTDVVVWTALVTPLTDEGQVDYANLDALVADQATAGNGILLLGSTGEGLALSLAEQQQIVLHVCGLAPSVPLMVAIGGHQLQAQLAWLDFCNALPIDAYLLASPLYAKPGPRGQTTWFDALLTRSKRPCMIYNVPSRSGVALSPQALQPLVANENFWALKEASGSVKDFRAFYQACPGVAIYSGDDALLPELVAAGAAGLVSVCANAWPRATQLYVQQSLAGDGDKLSPLWSDAIEPLFSVANPIPIKVLMHHQQRLSNPYLRPPLTHLEVDDPGALLTAEYRVANWLGQQQGVGN